MLVGNTKLASSARAGWVARAAGCAAGSRAMVSTRRGTVATPAAAEEPARGNARADADADGGGREISDRGMGMGMGMANPATLQERGKTGAEARPEACASETMARKEPPQEPCEVREHRTPPPEGRGGVQTRARKRSARLARNASSPTATGKTSTRARTASPLAAKAPRVQHKTSKAVVTPLHETNRKFALRKQQQAGPEMKKPPQGVLKKSSALASSASSSSKSSRAKAGRTSVLSLSTSLAENGVGSVTRRRVSSRLISSSKRRRVEFSSVEIHEMHLTIGESSVPNDGGPPIGISPRLKRSIIHNVDSFEAERLTGRRSADSVGSPLQQRISQERYKIEGRLPAALRREMLVRVAAEEEFIARAEAESQEIQRHREHTNMVDPFDTFFPGAHSDEPATYADPGEYAVSGTEAVEREVTSGRKFFGVADLF